MPEGIKPADAARVSRRSMLMGAAGAGAAGVAAATLGGAVRRPHPVGNPTSHGAQAADLSAADLAEPVVVHVRDAARGEIEVFRGTTSTRLQDRELAARLVRASAS
jgi:hypothetical protein